MKSGGVDSDYILDQDIIDLMKNLSPRTFDYYMTWKDVIYSGMIRLSNCLLLAIFGLSALNFNFVSFICDLKLDAAYLKPSCPCQYWCEFYKSVLSSEVTSIQVEILQSLYAIWVIQGMKNLLNHFWYQIVFAKI